MSYDLKVVGIDNGIGRMISKWALFGNLELWKFGFLICKKKHHIWTWWGMEICGVEFGSKLNWIGWGWWLSLCCLGVGGYRKKKGGKIEKGGWVCGYRRENRRGWMSLWLSGRERERRLGRVRVFFPIVFLNFFSLIIYSFNPHGIIWVRPCGLINCHVKVQQKNWQVN